MIPKAMKAFTLALGICILFFLASAVGKNDKPSSQLGSEESCGECHTCSIPTTDEPCLRPCPRFSKTVVVHSPEEGPSVVILDQLSDLYVPVVFPHKLHAQMEVMGEGCVACHHHTPTGHISPCRDCHGGPSNPQNLNQPSLKGAYHRQCMNCHREWSHDTECTVCHAKKTGEMVAIQSIDTTDIMGMLHPNIEEPEKRIYQTTYNGGTLVTFHHKDHIHLFGLKCVDCHKEENCSRCHEMGKKPDHVKSLEEHHKPCSSCHNMDRCDDCHAKTERAGFSHARTGWPLNRYHQNLSCHACHPAGSKIKKLNQDCVACHSNWTIENFKHAITGLALDETHAGIDCVDCHLDRKFDEKPSCVGCHDDGRTYPESSPGTVTGRKR
jgi:hypothetical protein